jgi:hypothetical protein
MNDIDDGPGGPEDRPRVTVTEAQKLAREIRAVSRKFILTMAAVVRWRHDPTPRPSIDSICNYQWWTDH